MVFRFDGPFPYTSPSEMADSALHTSNKKTQISMTNCTTHLCNMHRPHKTRPYCTSCVAMSTSVVLNQTVWTLVGEFQKWMRWGPAPMRWGVSDPIWYW